MAVVENLTRVDSSTDYDRITITSREGKLYGFEYNCLTLEQITKFFRVFEIRAEQLEDKKRVSVTADVEDAGTQYLAHACSHVFCPIGDDGVMKDYDAKVALTEVYGVIKSLRSKSERSKLEQAKKKLTSEEDKTSLVSAVESRNEVSNMVKLMAEMLDNYAELTGEMTEPQLEAFNNFMKNGTGFITEDKLKRTSQK